MKLSVFFLGFMFLFAVSAGAQTNEQASTSPASLPVATESVAPAGGSFLYASIVPTGVPALPVSIASHSPSSSQAGQQPSVYGVFQNYNWQLAAGYTFFRFYETRQITRDTNGLYISMVYYPGGHWIGADGEIVATFGSQGNNTAKFVLAGGGPRFRWSGPRNIELWGHGLIGIANFLPRTPFGTQSSFGFDAGGGADLNIHYRRLAYRFAAGVIGTRFFSTYQYSPYASGGIVYRF
jgi:hypothetical protein